MAKRAGYADLPLHGGRVPQWLADRMTRLGAVMAEAIVLEYGRDELLRRLAHPFWFQSFGAVMGMDWHSSGITTSVIGALKRGLEPLSGELGLHVCGGRGKHSRKTPDELTAIGERSASTARRGARQPIGRQGRHAAVQDGYDLYLHGSIVADDGHWVVVQQGMNGEAKQARRYHWLSEAYAASLMRRIGDRRRGAGRDRQPRRPSRRDVADTPGRDAGRSRAGGVAAKYARLERRRRAAPRTEQPLLPHLVMPAHHDVRAEDVVPRRLAGALAAATAAGPRFRTSPDGSRRRRSHRAGAGAGRRSAAWRAVRLSDPARHSFAHGGKDRHPFPVPIKVYDQTIAVMKSAVAKAKLGRDEELAA